MHNKAFYKKLAASVMALSLMTSFCACSGGSTTVTKRSLTSEELEEQAIKTNNARVRKFIKNSLGFEIKDELFEGAELEYDTADNSHGRAGLVIKPGKENEMLALLEKNLGMEKNIAPNLIPEDLNNEYAKDLRNMDLIKLWELSGTSVYMARKGSYSCVYIFT